MEWNNSAIFWVLSGKCSARCIDCIPTSASQQLYGRVILRRHGVMLSGPIDFFLFFFIALIYLFIYLFIYSFIFMLWLYQFHATSCTAIGGLQKAIAFWSLLWQISFSVEKHSYFVRTWVRCLDEVRFSANGRKFVLKESSVMLFAELSDWKLDFRVISLTAHQIVAVSLLSVISLLKQFCCCCCCFCGTDQSRHFVSVLFIQVK